MTYKDITKDPINSLILVAPLFVIYQIGILFPNVDFRNGADFVSKTIWRVTDYNGWMYAIFNLAVLCAVIGLYFTRRGEEKIDKSIVGLVLAESTIYAFVMGGIAAKILTSIGFHPPMFVSNPAINAGSAGQMDVFEAFIMSIGAGAYEELTFRLVLMGGMIFLMKKLNIEHLQTLIIAVLVSSIIFSAVHYRPFGMDSWELWSFSFRVILGIFLAIIYQVRGFAVAAYTHAIYDIFILVPRAF